EPRRGILVKTGNFSNICSKTGSHRPAQQAHHLTTHPPPSRQKSPHRQNSVVVRCDVTRSYAPRRPQILKRIELRPVSYSPPSEDELECCLPRRPIHLERHTPEQDALLPTVGRCAASNPLSRKYLPEISLPPTEKLRDQNSLRTS